MTDNALVILDATERAALTDCEATIERGLQTFVEVGTALPESAVMRQCADYAPFGEP